MIGKLGVVAELIEEGTALMSAVVVPNAAYVVYKIRQRGLGEPLGSSKDSHFDRFRVKGR